MSGAGAAKAPGRWNAQKEPVIYCAPTIALAVLEAAAHVDDSGLPQNKYLVEIQVLDRAWELIRRCEYNPLFRGRLEAFNDGSMFTGLQFAG